MKNKIIILIAVVFIITTTSCVSIMRQEMVYLGDQLSNDFLVGNVTHFDYLGIDMNGNKYANDYRTAIEYALRRAPEGTIGLQNIKAFKEYKLWPQLAGILASSLGALLFEESMVAGVILATSGVLLAGFNHYDFYIIAEPLIE